MAKIEQINAGLISTFTVVSSILIFVSIMGLAAYFFYVNLGTIEPLNSLIEKKNYRLYDLDEIADLPKSILIEKYLKEEIF